jgi:hypothetical protein
MRRHWLFSLFCHEIISDQLHPVPQTPWGAGRIVAKRTAAQLAAIRCDFSLLRAAPGCVLGTRLHPIPCL